MMNQKPAAPALPTNTTMLLELFDKPTDQPTAIILLPRACDPQLVITAVLSGQLLKSVPVFYALRKTSETSLATLAWLYGDWPQSSITLSNHRLTVLSAPGSAKSVSAKAAEPMPVLAISDPACFPLAGIFLPTVLRTKDFSIHAHLQQINEPSLESSVYKPSTTPESTISYAIRWTSQGQTQVFFLVAPATLPPAMLHTLLAISTRLLSAWCGQTVDLAGPVAVAKIDPRLRNSEWHYKLTIRKKTVSLILLIPNPVGRFLESLFPSQIPLPVQAYAPDSILTGLLALNRRLLDRGAGQLLQTLDAANENSLACFLADNSWVFTRQDLTFLVQNYLVPQGTPAILDFFFPRDSFDPTTWARTSQALGEKLTATVAQALKEGKNHDSGLTTETARALLRAVASKRIELSPRGETLILTVLGQAIDGESRRALDPLIEQGLPGKLLARVPAGERMKALANLSDRERSMCFYGDRDSVLILMEAFSEKGKQREQDDFDLMMKAVDRGDIDYASLVQAKTEACQFIAEHLLNAAMGKAPDADWKALRAKLKPETLLFLLEDPGSCLAESPLRIKFAKGLAPVELKLLKEKLSAEAKLPGFLKLQPALMHQELINASSPI